MHKRDMETKVSESQPLARIDREKFALAIRIKRGSRAYRDVGPEAKVHYRNLQKYETCAALPTADAFAQICEWLGMKMDEFVMEAEVKP